MSEVLFDLGLACLVVSVVIGCGAVTVRSLRLTYTELIAQARERGLDPETATLQTIAEMQAHERSGWHPIERLAIRVTVWAWRSPR